jgi:hypothetical protein
VSKLEWLVIVPLLGGCAATGWRAERVDGGSRARFEASVAALQNDLPPRRRERFAIALTAIWLRNSMAAGDVNGDGLVDIDDVRALNEIATEVLPAVRRGDLLPAVEAHALGARGYTTQDLIERLDGLSYDEVLGLAGRLTGQPYLAAMGRLQAQDLCARSPRDVPPVLAKLNRCDHLFDR